MTGEPYVLRPKRFFGCGRQLRALVDDIDAMTPPAHSELSPLSVLRALVDDIDAMPAPPNGEEQPAGNKEDLP